MIDTQTALEDLIAGIVAADRVGVDTEADSLYSYYEKVCLVQIGLPEVNELVDPLAGVDLKPLLVALADTELVMHGADFDLRMLYRVGLGTPSKVFDTMIAARLVGTARYSYAALVAEHFDITLSKGQQKANWGQRPLGPELADYARNDTRYLLPLAEHFERRLDALGRRAWLEQSCRRVVDAARTVRERDPQREWRVRGSHDLGPRASAVLRSLWYWREHEAQTVDHPPFHILSNANLVAAARRFDHGDTVRIPKLRGARQARFFQAANDALQLPPLKWPRRPASRPRQRLSKTQAKHAAELKQRRQRAAIELGIDEDLILPRNALERIAAEIEGSLEALLPWQRALLGWGD